MKARMVGWAVMAGLTMPMAWAAPPPTVAGADHTVLHGVEVKDPYRWLEDTTATSVRDWYQAQNAFAEEHLANTAQGQALTQRVAELSDTGPSRYGPQMAGGTLFYFQHVPPQAQPVLMAQDWPDGQPRAVIDPNATGENIAITGVWPSPQGRYVAYGVASGGDELTTLQVLDVRSGKTLRDELPWAGGGTTAADVAWDEDEKGFVFVRFPAPAKGQPVEQFHAALWHHRLGQSARRDRLVFGQDYSAIAAWRLLPGPDGRLAILAHVGDGSPAEVWMRDGADAEFTRVLGLEQDVRRAAWVGGRLVAVSFAEAPRGQLLAVARDGTVTTLLPQRTGAIQRVSALGDGFLVHRSWGIDNWVEHYDVQGRFVRRLALPEDVGIGSIVSASGQGSALITWSTWSQPMRWVRYDADTGAFTTLFAPTLKADYSGLRVHRIDGVSRDGTRVPVVVLALDGVEPNGQRPAILYGYGGFALPRAPGFIGANLAWLERGGIYAHAVLRGGNEFGEDWHRQGQKLDKQNVFDDFHAAMEALLDSGWTDREHLGIMGGSNGGLLVGAALVQHPGDVRAVVGQVGIYDCLRHESEFANGKYNVPEYGTIADADQFRATLSWSPLHNVVPGTDYPAMLMTTGVNDSRVAAWQSHKFAAALQQASHSDRPVLVVTRSDAGHGMGAPFSQRVGNAALSLVFLAEQLSLGEPIR